MSIDDYYTRLMGLYDELDRLKPLHACACGKCTCDVASRFAADREEEKLHQFLIGINDELYATVRSNLLSTSPFPDLDCVYQACLQEEKSRGIARDRADKEEIHAFALQTARPKARFTRPDKSKLYCSVCDIFVSRDVKFHENEFPYKTVFTFQVPAYSSSPPDSNVGIDVDCLEDLESALVDDHVAPAIGTDIVLNPTSPHVPPALLSPPDFADDLGRGLRDKRPSVLLHDFVTHTVQSSSPSECSSFSTSSSGGYSKLEVFRGGFNLLSGPLPHDIYNATALREISLPSNHLMGPIDNSIVHLSNLTILELSYNELISGELPQDIGKLSNMEKLLLENNNLSGSLPPSIMSCTNLIVLNLRDNFLEGDISALNFSKLQRLRTLDFGYNNFSGNLPETLYSCKSLAAIRFAGNKLEGQILPQILALQSLSFLSLSANRLTNITGAIRILNVCKSLKFLFLSMNFIGETMPDDDTIVALDGFKSLEVLGLRNCHLTGEVPPWLAKLRKLEYLDVSVNQLTGPVPGWLWSLPGLFYIDLSHNQLSGEFPQELSKLPALTSEHAAAQVDRTYLELPIFTQPTNATFLMYKRLSSIPPSIILSNNSLSGRIPVEIGQLQFLHVLDLSYNNFSGHIPDQISKLTNLEKLNLSSNHLSGEIPTSLGSLHFLSSFSVSNNHLEGPIPPGTQLQSFPASAYMGNPELCGRPLPNNCEPITGNFQHQNVEEEAYQLETPLFYLTVGFGYSAGFWLVCSTLLFDISWRDAYFRFMNDVKDKVYVMIAFSAARLQRRPSN
ncbi:hypothetical protein F0562_001625 [Nyssa sinensis]|uniref:Leucine-rich repeat-containing N-terminal plant-type domain-containing protein n=1 Tax=Nyssa sinensis TaxID=561372 RepID=A0A5J5C8Q0_9ASTE|nr:hypothetical protein F0562_001625 [Nyssa sinensis]